MKQYDASKLCGILKKERHPRFKERRQKEYDGIVAKGGVKAISRAALPKDNKFIGSRFVLGIKEPGTFNPVFKSRWILQGHQDRYRHSIVNDSPMLMSMMFPVITALAAKLFNCNFWTRDVEQAYMQSKPLQRDVFTEATPEAKLPSNKVLKIELPYYGLVEASSCFFDTYYPVFTKQLGMICAVFNPCFFFRLSKDERTGITCVASDDSINTGDKRYQNAEETATKSFITRKKDSKILYFLGSVIHRLDSHIDLYQDNHIERLQQLDTKDIDRMKFRTIRGQLLFITQSSRRDIAYSVSQLCQAKYEDVSKKHIRMLNEVVQNVKETRYLKLKYRKIRKEAIRILKFVDSGYKTDKDYTSQLGLLICLADGEKNA